MMAQTIVTITKSKEGDMLARSGLNGVQFVPKRKILT